MTSAIPLAVDLDGTLVRSDTLHDGALRALREHPFALLQLPLWLLQGKAVVKQQLAALSQFDPATLPYHQPLIEWLTIQRSQGRKLVLCTAADQHVAIAIADHLGIFDEVLASDGSTNLGGRSKAEALERRFGIGGFDYAGNAAVDLHVWQRARKAVVVNASSEVKRKAQTVAQVDQIFDTEYRVGEALLRTLRPHQWAKNLLLFMAPMAAHLIPDGEILSRLLFAFVAFSLCASAVYVTNDLLDLDSDRQHPRKRMRAFAAGQLSVVLGVVLVPVLLVGALLCALPVGWAFCSWLLFYFALTCAYSLALKRLMIIDCLALAMLYTLRVIAGAAAVNIPLSFWLLAFSAFFFLSLAFVKRYAELDLHSKSGSDRAHGRGYLTSDTPLVQAFGLMSGYASVVVLALYLNSDAVVRLYRSPELIWAAVPILLYWISRIWMKAHRGEMHDDPLVFAMRDRVGLLAGVLFFGVLIAGSRGWVW